MIHRPTPRGSSRVAVASRWPGENTFYLRPGGAGSTSRTVRTLSRRACSPKICSRLGFRQAPVRRQMMGVGNCDRQRVGGVGADDLRAGEQPLDHGMDLRLSAPPLPTTAFTSRGIFADVEAGAGGDHQDDAAGLAELQGRLGVLVDENLLDRGGLGAWSASNASSCEARWAGASADFQPRSVLSCPLAIWLRRLPSAWIDPSPSFRGRDRSPGS